MKFPNTRIHRLQCGMPLLIYPLKDTGVATADIWVRTGSADEPPHLWGVSHFLEHMLFKGTEKFGPGEIEHKIESVGGEFNAGTSLDFTHYYVTMPSNVIGIGMKMLAEMVRRPAFDPEELEKERHVILEEYRRLKDHPQGVLTERILSVFYQQGPYHQHPIGTFETVEAITQEDMSAYHQARYAPDNMAFVLTGDFNPDQLIALAEEAFMDFHRPLEQIAQTQKTQYGLGLNDYTVKPTGGEVYTSFSFPAPGMESGSLKEMMAIHCIQLMLGQGDASRLHRELKEELGLCSWIGAYLPSRLRENQFMIHAACQPEQFTPLRTALIALLEDFIKHDPTPQAMTRAIRMSLSANRFQRETCKQIAWRLGECYTLTGGTSFYDDYSEQFEQLDAAYVGDVIRKILHPDPSMITQISVGPECIDIASSNEGNP